MPMPLASIYYSLDSAAMEPDRGYINVPAHAIGQMIQALINKGVRIIEIDFHDEYKADTTELCLPINVLPSAEKGE